MNSTQILKNIQSTVQNSVTEFFNKTPKLLNTVNKIINHNGKAYLVGGAVRDILLNRPIKDIDIEIHKISLDSLSSILKEFGHVSHVGKSFGVLKVNGLSADFSLPRIDLSSTDLSGTDKSGTNKFGTNKFGRKPEVNIDPFLNIKQALSRRDLTINAMAIDLDTLEFIDPFNGYKDLQTQTLRSPNIDFFAEDPLRFFRVLQFISRFQMLPDKELTNTCKTMDINSVSIERIETEFEKLLLNSKYPSMALRWLLTIGRVKDVLPNLEKTVYTPQEHEWHPEGHVFEHLMQALDASATLYYDDNNIKLTVMFAALCHDLGKIETTKLIDGRLRSLGHAEAGVSLSKDLLKKITTKKDLIEAVASLVRWHMQPPQLAKQDSSLAAYKRLALRLNKHTNLKMLTKLSLADNLGRNGESFHPLNCSDKKVEAKVEFINKFIKKAREADVYTNTEEPILTGKDIQDIVKPGPNMGKLLKYAYNIQINKEISDKEQLIKLVKAQNQREKNANK